MGQKIFFNYKAPLASNAANESLLGILEPGRYRGFDLMASNVLAFKLTHDLTGIIQTQENLLPSGPLGVIYTKQGFIIQQDEKGVDEFSCDTNAGNPNERIDLVICEHQDVNVIGGSDAIYMVIKGSLSGPIEPALPNPTYQTAIGTIRIPAGANNLSSAIYTPKPCPMLGGYNFFGGNFPELNDVVRKSIANTFEKTNTDAIQEVLVINVNDSTGVITCSLGGNIIEVNMKEDMSIKDFKNGVDDFPTGTLITVKIKSTNGIMPFGILVGPSSNIEDYKSTVADEVLTLQVNDSLELYKSNTKWVLISINGYILRSIKSLLPLLTVENWKYDLYTSQTDGIIYRKTPDGWLHIQGILAYPNATRTLPVGYRPSSVNTFPSMGVIQNSGNPVGPGTLLITIDTSGVISATPPVTVLGSANVASVYIDYQVKL